ncbi:unnamed protein product [Cylindrotheca closterium]|uniref:Uncharacterized protein n=1 Tax=Cylindrotheca closterium TaxID=2856 RepID=A0AAD2G0T1_9STRA|nr:unnamed protein product [Cylindrotheca closterium]
MSPPRPITGRIGSRIKVVLPDDGNSWLLVLDHDDGNREWQSQDWRSIPNGLSKQIKIAKRKGEMSKTLISVLMIRGMSMEPNPMVVGLVVWIKHIPALYTVKTVPREADERISELTSPIPVSIPEQHTQSKGTFSEHPLAVACAMGKRKPVPKRNANPTVSEVVPPVPPENTEEEKQRKRRRLIIDDNEDTVFEDPNDDSGHNEEVVVVGVSSDNENGKHDNAADTSENDDSSDSSTIRLPQHEVLAQALNEIFSSHVQRSSNCYEQANRSLRLISDKNHLEICLKCVVFEKEYEGNSSAVLSAIMEHGMLCVHVSHNEGKGIEIPPRRHCIFQRQFQPPEKLNERTKSYSLQISITDAAFELAAPGEVSTYLLGTNSIRMRTHKSLRSTLALRKALAQIFPKSLIHAVDNDPSGKNMEPIRASFVYQLIDNCRFEQRCKEMKEKGDDAPPRVVDGLQPEMREYQSFAVEWMLRREQQEANKDDGIWQVCWLVLCHDGVTPLTRFLETQEDRQDQQFDPLVFLNPFTGALCRSLQEARLASVGPKCAGVRGGILAESMGLGKTVEVLACILSHPRPMDDTTNVSLETILAEEQGIKGVAFQQTLSELQDPLSYKNDHRCPSCSAKSCSKEPIKSRGTLIVTPPAILEQWAREIRRHSSKTLKIVIYRGVKQLCDGKIDVEERLLIHPHVLADADIVLTTFPVLNSELPHSDNQFLNGGKSFRAKKRYRVVPSPLNSIQWWRICLDEAQRVEGTAAAAAKMALRLHAKQRWCVTGTPIGRGKLDDLYGLLLFIGIMPFQLKDSFRHCHHSFLPGLEERIKHMLYPIFWRSTKSNPHIRVQLGIPEQIERKVVLDFSSIERHFYKKQLEQTLLVVNEGLKGKKKMERISGGLHSLRAACCHPQVGSSGIQKLGRRGASGLSNRVLSMQQVLDKIIDDARTKCEESQRIATLHTNALACISKLKVELKQWEDAPFQVQESDETLLDTSSKLYSEALELTDKNAEPSPVVGEAIISGCESLEGQTEVCRDGRVVLRWKLEDPKNDFSTLDDVWANAEFSSGKKLTAFKVRPLVSSYGTSATHIIPKTCVLQVALASLGGSFVDVRRFSFDKQAATDWLSFGGIRTNRSKIWRIRIESAFSPKAPMDGNNDSSIVGLEVNFMEPSVGQDDLQRMHILHNSTNVVDSLIQLKRNSPDPSSGEALNGLETRLKKFNGELTTLESNYLGFAKSNHRASQVQLQQLRKQQYRLEEEFYRLSGQEKLKKKEKERWWQDLLSLLAVDVDGKRLSSHAKDYLCNVVKNDLYELFNGDFSHGSTGFPQFESIAGLQMALQSRLERLHSSRMWMKRVVELSDDPSMGEILENSTCRKCRADWFQTGPVCRHCKLEETMLEYETGLNDRVFLTILKSIARWLSDVPSKYHLGHGQVLDMVVSYQDQADAYLKLVECERKELAAAKRHWRVHFDMLSDYDELNACKSTMRLPRVGEKLSSLPQQELDRIVIPRNMPALVMDHKVKQASALAALRRDIACLRYLKNQSVEQGRSTDDETKKEKPTCPVCLTEFGLADRAVLKCGHSLHTKCIDEILKRSSGSSSIVRCPMKCLSMTSRDEILIAAAEDSLKQQDPRSTVIVHNNNKKFEGSWGTKVDRLIGDLMEVIEKGERCLVFSQWDEMLAIVESALFANKIAFTHPKGAKSFGASAQALRSTCQVMLLNVKSGAEGLTLVEATHVFMIEPLMDSGLDSQAINRVHRIGQTAKTYVHRYIIQNTIEEKIDAIRMDRQVTYEDEGEASLLVSTTTKNSKDSKIPAGGLDGGLTSEELREILSSI